jgi:hypothetical protein
MDAIRSELISEGQAALSNVPPDTERLQRVVSAFVTYNKIQGEIDALKAQIDAIDPVPVTPTGQIRQ